MQINITNNTTHIIKTDCGKIINEVEHVPVLLFLFCFMRAYVFCRYKTHLYLAVMSLLQHRPQQEGRGGAYQTVHVNICFPLQIAHLCICVQETTWLTARCTPLLSPHLSHHYHSHFHPPWFQTGKCQQLGVK